MKNPYQAEFQNRKSFQHENLIIRRKNFAGLHKIIDLQFLMFLIECRNSNSHKISKASLAHVHLIHSLQKIDHRDIINKTLNILVPHGTKLWINRKIIKLLLDPINIFIIREAQQMSKKFKPIIERCCRLLRRGRIARKQKYLTMRKSRFYAFLQQFDNVETTSNSQNANRRLCRLCDVEQIVQQRLILMSAEEIKLVQNEYTWL